MYKWMEIKVFPINQILRKQSLFKFMEIGLYGRN